MDRNEQITNMEEFIIKDSVLIDYTGKGGDVVIPDSVKVIDQLAFYNCHGLTSINIPNSVTEIGWRAFEDCCDLTSINIPNSVTEIGGKAFRGCTGLDSINISDSVTEIGESVFAFCFSLTSINIPDSVMRIGEGAFYNCSRLTSINIPDAVVGNISYIFSGTKIKRVPQGNIAYKGFNADMTCRGFQYEEGKTYVCDKAQLCQCGFHACLNPLDCFSYYYDKNVVYHEVILEDRTGEKESDSKICGRKITIGRRLTLQEMISIFNELNK